MGTRQVWPAQLPIPSCASLLLGTRPVGLGSLVEASEGSRCRGSGRIADAPIARLWVAAAPLAFSYRQTGDLIFPSFYILVILGDFGQLLD